MVVETVVVGNRAVTMQEYRAVTIQEQRAVTIQDTVPQLCRHTVPRACCTDANRMAWRSARSAVQRQSLAPALVFQACKCVSFLQALVPS